MERERLPEALEIVRRLLLSDENPAKMSKEKFKIRAAVLAKGTMNLRATLMIGDCFFEHLARNMVTSSGNRGHPLTHGTAIRVLKENGFYDATNCARCRHYVIPAGKIGLNQLSPQRQNPALGYDRQACLLPYCMGCQRLCMERSMEEEEQLDKSIRRAYPAHKPLHVGTRTMVEVNELKQAFKDAGSPPPSHANKCEIDRFWDKNMNCTYQDRRLKKIKLQV